MQVEATIPAIDLARNARLSADDGRLGAMWGRFVTEVNALPDVSAAAIATLSPLTGRDRGVLVGLVGGPEIAQNLRSIHVNQVTAGYFAAMATRLVAGRPFTAADRAGSPRVAILNESAARAYFGPGSGALGRQVNFPGQLVEDAYEVVGVVRDTRYVNLRTPDERMAYLPLEQSIDPIGNAMLVVRGRTAHPTALVASIRDTASKLLPSGFISRIATLEQQVEASLLAERLLSILATIFGGLALALACIGLYGVMAQRVVSRAREIAIRIAIGARRGSVIWMVVRGTLALLTIGTIIGAGAAIAAGRYVRSVLFEVSPADPLAMIGAVAFLATVALAASYLPVRRATHIEPAVALRAE
jgi:predicted permease